MLPNRKRNLHQYKNSPIWYDDLGHWHSHKGEKVPWDVSITFPQRSLQIPICTPHHTPTYYTCTCIKLYFVCELSLSFGAIRGLLMAFSPLKLDLVVYITTSTAGWYGVLQHHQFGALHLGTRWLFTQSVVPSIVSFNFHKHKICHWPSRMKPCWLSWWKLVCTLTLFSL